MNRKAEIVSFLGAAIFMALFISLSVLLIGRSNSSSSLLMSKQEKVALVLQGHSVNSQAKVVSSARSISDDFELAVTSDMNLSNSKLIAISDNQRAIKCIVTFRLIEQQVLPSSDIRFFYHLYSANSREFPALS